MRQELKQTGAQRGQAIPLGIATMLFAVILTLVLFNTGQMTSEKMRLDNTADAAAYSGMVWQARSLNFDAYTNRAMVANQVAIAQFVSFVSWGNYLKVATQNISTITSYIPVLNAITAAIAQAASVVDSIAQAVATIAIPAIDAVIDVLSASQTAVQGAAVVATTDIVQEVVKQNDPQYRISASTYGFLAANAVGWLNFTEQYSVNAMQTRMQDVIMRSRDGFTSNRGWQFNGPDIGIASVYINKGGDTRLLSSGDATSRTDSNLDWEWKAKDTLSLHFKWRCPSFWNPGRWCYNEVPVGWGEAYASTTGQDFCSGGSFFNTSGGCGSNSWTANGTAESLADTDNPTSLAGYHGVRPYRDVAGLNVDDISDSTHDPRLGLTVEVYKPGTAVRTSAVAGIGSPGNPQANRSGIEPGMFRMSDNFSSELTVDNGLVPSMAAISKAEVFFRRPDGKSEYANLFNPYWDVHLVSSRSERVASWALRGILDFTGSAGGGGAVPGL